MGKEETDRLDDLVKDMDSDEILKPNEKFYDMTRDEQHELGLKRVRRYIDLFGDKYFMNFKPNYLPWWVAAF